MLGSGVLPLLILLFLHLCQSSPVVHGVVWTLQRCTPARLAAEIRHLEWSEELAVELRWVCPQAQVWTRLPKPSCCWWHGAPKDLEQSSRDLGFKAFKDGGSGVCETLMSWSLHTLHGPGNFEQTVLFSGSACSKHNSELFCLDT